MHHKFAVIDGACLINGSFNWWVHPHNADKNKMALINSGFVMRCVSMRHQMAPITSEICVPFRTKAASRVNYENMTITNVGGLIQPSARPPFCWHSLTVSIETPTNGREGCSGMTVSAPARLVEQFHAQFERLWEEFEGRQAEALPRVLSFCWTPLYL